MLKEILEKAYKKENMQWRVYAFDPEKDNELVYTSKAFDCIADAQVDKVEQLKKHPNYIVEISTTRVEESAQKNEAMPPKGQRKRIDFEDDIVRVYDGNKEIYAGTEDYEPMKDENWKWDEANKYYKLGKYIKVCCESAQKNEDFGPNDIVLQAKQMDFKKQYLKGKDARKINKNSFYFDGVDAVDDNTGSNIPGAKLGMKYKDLANALDKFFSESTQKNEAKTYHVTGKYHDGKNAGVSLDAKVPANSEEDAIKLAQKYYERKYNAKAFHDMKAESAQKNEDNYTRKFNVVVEIATLENMNNKMVEDRFEDILENRGFKVIDITATRK